MRFVTDLNKGILGKPDPGGLWNKVISYIPDSLLIKKDFKVLCVACGHGTEADVIVKRMLSLGRAPSEIKDSIYLLDKYKVFTKDALRKGYTNVIKADFLEWETDMKFDAVVGNPPYSLAGNKTGKKGRAKNLYPDFYKKALELSDHVCMIVPNTSRQHIAFNSFIRETTNKIIPIDDSVFDVNISVWCLIKDNTDTNVLDIDWADLYEIPEQKVKWAKGKINVTTESDLLIDKPGPYTVFHKINGTGLIQTTTDTEISPLKLFPKDGYVVIMPQQIQNQGWTDTAIVKCTGKQAATNGVNLAFVDTLEEANYLVDYMKQENFVSQALTHCGGMRNMTLGAMQRINMDDYAY